MALSHSSDKRLAKNTIFLYFRTFLLLIIGVFTSRITLQVLGVDNYGIVNVVSGFVTMFSLISGSLTAACQRFITYELGREKPDVHSVFNTSVQLHLSLAFIVLLLAETAGLYFINHKLNLPEGQHVAVQWVYQCSIISFLLSLINIPYNAIIIAHEKMAVFAYISLLEGILKLLVVVALIFIESDKLILYATLGLASSIIVRCVFQWYCRSSFHEAVKLSVEFNSNLIKRIFSFAGWSFIGNAASIFSNQGVNIVINIFCGVAVNAARGIGVMVENIITNFVTNFTTALNPQITKAYASNDKSNLDHLMDIGVRLTSYLMLIIAVPIIICSSEILNVWFVEVPAYASAFVKLTLVTATIQAVANPFLTLMFASGNIRNYQITVGIITFLNLPFSYVILKSGSSPVYVYCVAILLALISFVVRLYFVKNYTKMNCNALCLRLMPRIVIIYTCSIVFGMTLHKFIAVDTLLKLICYGIVVTILNVAIVYLIGLKNQERNRVNHMISAKLIMLSK